ncbi:Glycoside-Pentoside-Hexuronide (GPH):Cation Symporter Family [Achlya hypogyna]|uniref:Glycoside-Pentoside-Hexuronide (GPH):Cation Symporter Family n=1 Tax=Achlya hypogyna TaxID=1202772 RepID=A0A1V9YZ28_ACHHY|nr:Glycoside-Pentoside-Hexuronide (GPH):Cation Symporter Family [Achlya hypogyna]
MTAGAAYIEARSPAADAVLKINDDLIERKTNADEDADGAQPVVGCSIPFMFLMCAPCMAMNMAWAAQWAALGPLLQILLPSSAVQLVQLVGPVTGVLVTPAVGVLSDNCTSTYGRRRPFLFWGALSSAACWLVMMFTVEIGEALGDADANAIAANPETASRKWTTVFTVLCYVWMDITVNLTQVPNSLMIADFAGDRQVTAAAVNGGYATAGSFFVSGYILACGPAHQSIKRFLSILIGIMLGTCLTVCLFVKEKQYTRVKTLSRCRQIGDAFLAVWTGIRLLPKRLAIYCIIIVFSQYGFTAYSGAKGQFFGIVVKGGVADGADSCGIDDNPKCSTAQIAFNDGVELASGTTDTIYNCVGLLALVSLPFFVRKFGVKAVVTVALIPQVLLCAMAFCKNIPIDMIIVIACSIPQNVVLYMCMPVIIHVIGHSSESGLGMFAGALNSALCTGQFLNFIFSSILVTSSMGYALPVLVGGILSTIAFFVALFLWDIKSYTM